MDSEQELTDALREQLGGNIFPIHRLDWNVGGVVICARTKKAAAELSSAVQQGTVVKEYVALVHGMPEPEGRLEDWLFKDSRKNKVFAVKKERKGVKKAVLDYRVLEQGSESLIHVRLHTGRSHQIRVQFSSRGFPLVGDHKYGSRAVETAPMLYSCRITFPYAGVTVSYGSLPQWALAATGGKLLSFSE